MPTRENALPRFTSGQVVGDPRITLSLLRFRTRPVVVRVDSMDGNAGWQRRRTCGCSAAFADGRKPALTCYNRSSAKVQNAENDTGGQVVETTPSTSASATTPSSEQSTNPLAGAHSPPLMLRSDALLAAGLTTTVTTVAVPATLPTRPFAADLAWLLCLPAPGSVGRDDGGPPRTMRTSHCEVAGDLSISAHARLP
jgi:hypothetical protein